MAAVALQSQLFDQAQLGGIAGPGDAPTPVAAAPAVGDLERRWRTDLEGAAWVEHLPGWVSGSDELFSQLCQSVRWQQPEVPMYERLVVQPRLSAVAAPGDLAEPTGSILAAAGQRLSELYDVELSGCGLNLYRHGRDSVAWHGDRHGRRRPEALVAIISLGARRPFLLRPAGGGPSRRWLLGRGDLLVMGGTCQRTWQHTVPKVAAAGPRISVTFRWPHS